MQAEASPKGSFQRLKRRRLPSESRLVLARSFLGFILLVAGSCDTAPSPQESTPLSVLEPPAGHPWEHERSDLPVDPRLRFGHLENGLRWVWVHNASAEGWVHMRLHVRVGSLAEEDDELGMAHFVEHMGFNGTEHHPAGTLVEWFQRWGDEFGPDVNASTSFDQTLYWIEVPVHVKENFDQGLLVLRDFAFGASFLPEEVEAEKGVVDSEERERDSPEQRIHERQLRSLFPDSRLARRSPIGQREVRARFTPEALRAFHCRWYRPENMTLILVGDLSEVDPDAAIERIFGDGPHPTERPARQAEAGTERPAELRACFFEPAMGHAKLRILATRPPAETPHDRRRLEREAVLDAARTMVKARLVARSHAGDSPFLHVHVTSNDGSGINDGEELRIQCPPEHWQEALAAGEQELRRAFEHGFARSSTSCAPISSAGSMKPWSASPPAVRRTWRTNSCAPRANATSPCRRRHAAGSSGRCSRP